MSNMQDGFLGKVSKGIKQRIFDDEPDAVSDSLLIGRLQSLADTESSSNNKKSVESMPDIISATNAQKLQASEPATSHPVAAGDLAAELAIKPAPPSIDTKTLLLSTNCPSPMARTG
jgi:hypothetical protein